MAQLPAAHAAFDSSAASLQAENAGSVSLDAVASLSFTPISAGSDLLKRGVDIVGGLLFAVVLMPLILVVALAVAATQSGSFLVTEWRVGRNGERFAAIRFRTQGEGNTRRSAFGRLLHRTRLDELPLLVNVLAGDLSLVGPPAATPEEAARLAALLPGYTLRHLVRPGLTGWSQTMGEWSQGDAGRRLGYDLYYVRHCSLALDLRIMLRTALLMLLGHAGR